MEAMNAPFQGGRNAEYLRESRIFSSQMRQLNTNATPHGSKREHLLNEIRAQAAEIERLMTQLQLANRQASEAATQGLTSPPRSPYSSGNSMCSPSRIGFASLPPEKFTTADQDVIVPKAEVLDWVAKAKESIEAFGGYIGIGTASVAKNLIEDSDDSVDSDEDDDDRFLSARGSDDEGASVASEDRGFVSRHRHVSPETRGRRRDLSSEKPATIPSHVAPFGLMANLLRKTRLDDGQGEENAENADEVGVARKDYFRASACNRMPRVFPSHQLRIAFSVATPDPTARISDVGHDLNPDILTGGIVTPGEVEKLFKM